MITIIQKGDLTALDFDNNNAVTNGVSVNDGVGSTIANAINSIVYPNATNTVPGFVTLAVPSEYPSNSNSEAATPSYVATAVAAAIAAIPADKHLASVGAYNATTNSIILTMSDATTLTLNLGALITDTIATIPAATDTVAGKVALAVAANHPSTSDVEATTPAYVAAAISTAVANLPADKFITGLGSYNATTNVLTLNLSDGSTALVDMTALVADAVASVPVATSTTTGTVTLAVASEYVANNTNDTEATTPAYVAAAIADVAVAPWTTQASIATVDATTDGIGNIVNYPTTAAIPLADFADADAASTAISLDMSEALFSNRAVEPTAKGMMNTDGTLGNFAKSTSLANFPNDNGSFLNASGGATTTLPAGRYVGQTAIISTVGTGTVIVQGNIRGFYKNSVGDIVVSSGSTVIDTYWTVGETFHVRWNGTAWQITASSRDLPIEVVSAINDVATLDAGDRGLSRGIVSILQTDLPLTQAQVNQTNSTGVAVSLSSMDSLFTNKATETAAVGVMNTVGTPGYYSVSASTVADALLNNGASVTVSGASGDITFPDGNYEGQIVNVNCGGSDASIDGKFRGILRNSVGKFEDFSGGSVVQIILKVRESVIFRWNGNTWIAISANFLEFHAQKHALVDVAALTSQDRGLTLGFVDIPTNRALTIAEMTQLQADKVAVPLDEMQSVFTNRAVEPTATGVMNPDGLLGNKTTLTTAATNANWTTAIVEALDYNDSYVRVGIVNGDTFALPAPRYIGQKITLRFGGSAAAEAVVSSSVGFSGGSYRNSQHVITSVGTLNVIVRPSEVLELVGVTATAWAVVNHSYRLYATSQYQEATDGTSTLYGFAGFSTVIPAGNNFVIDQSLPVLITNPTAIGVLLNDVDTTAAATLGLGGAGPVEPVTYFHARGANTVSTIRIGAINAGAGGYTPGNVHMFVYGAKLDYAALGGIASF